MSRRHVALLASAFAGVATILSAIGLYGLIAYGVTRRTRELGVRVALGAQRGDVLSIVLREAGAYLVLGLVVGLPVTLILARYLESQLFGLSSRDPLVVTLAMLVLTISVALATAIPARRAASVDPVVALRTE